MSSIRASRNNPMARRRKLAQGYTRQDIKNAINLIVERGTSIRRAAYICNVPRTTLSSYLKSLTQGKVCKLLPEEEQDLFQWMTDCCKRGFSIKKRNVENAAEQVVKRGGDTRTHPFHESEFGRRCYQRFLKRWLAIDRIKERKHIGLIPDWFLHIECYLLEQNAFDVLNYPNRIFLCDGLRFQDRLDLPHDIKDVLQTMTMLYTFTAAGEHLSPLIVYPFRREVPAEIVKGAPKNCAVVAQENGTVTPKTFAAYLEKVVHKFTVANKIPPPIVLYVDESQIDMTIDLSNACKSLGIILLGLSASQVTKPTANVFSDVVTGWKEEVPRWVAANHRPFTLVECAAMMQTINKKCIRDSVLIGDFCASDLFPWNRPVNAGEPGDATALLASFDDNPDDDNEIENFLENVDCWSDDDDEAEEEEEEEDDAGDEGEDEEDEEDLEELSGDAIGRNGVGQLIPVDVNEREDGDSGGHQHGEPSSMAGTLAIRRIELLEDEEGGRRTSVDRPWLEDVDINIRFSDFKQAIGEHLVMQFAKKLETDSCLPFGNHAENVLFDIYRQFRSDDTVAIGDDIEVVDISDD